MRLFLTATAIECHLVAVVCTAYNPIVHDAPYERRVSGESLCATYKESNSLVLRQVQFLRSIIVALALIPILRFNQ